MDPLSNTPLLDQVVTPADLRRLLSRWLGLSAFARIKDMRPALSPV